MPQSNQRTIKIRSKMNQLRPVTIAIVSFAVCAVADPASGSSPPNVLIIMCDDLGYADVGFNGAKDITTPSLDELANSGTICTSAYVAHPVCGPSRAAIMTGRYPHNFGEQFNLPDHHEMGTPLSEVFLSQLLKDAGYYTGAIGKWHLGQQPQYQPNQRGFDEFYGILGGGHQYFPEKYRPKYEKAVRAGQKKIPMNISPLQRNGKDARETEYVTDAFSREAVAFLEQASTKNQPWFLYLSYTAPHSPIEAKADDMSHFTHIADKKRRTYAAMVYAVDRGVGRVVDTLKSTGNFDDTLIIFLSDNGGKAGGSANNAPLKGGKRGVEEGGYRVPMFFHWPSNVPAGQKFHHPILSLDFYPTLARLTSSTIPEGKMLDGKDVWDELLAGTNPHPDEMIYAMSHRSGYTDVSGRRNQWKVSRTRRRWQLYDVVEDIGETHDLSKRYPERLKQMVSDVEKWGRNHQMPQWHYFDSDYEAWAENKLPYFDGTFDIK
ncbi:Arylsulfatase [Planctomycetes bacterium CA13]|uniref:Arylsulfatase n=2 Tax=Novipirellula herctigrandis TaxID=2527986 RepID=A0A5C5Z279_9BACT|nr:Arylsulfatase [Planctomycetes bacterium CA13]